MTPATCVQTKTIAEDSAADPCVATAGIVGGSGYTGALLAELLVHHPSVKLTHMSSETLKGDAVQQHLPRVRAGLEFCGQADLSGVDVAFVCTPHGEAAAVAKRLLDDGARVIDLSADFRLSAEAYTEWYGEHPHPELLPGVYGLTELHREEVAAAALVANPGCYPTAALLALAPLKRLGLLDVVIDAKSGVSGAGKTPQGTTHFCSVDSDLGAFGAGPGGDGRGPQLTFVPHLVPLQRGISETIYVRAGTFPVPSQARVMELYEEFYAGEQFVEVCGAPPQLKDVAGTNYCRIFPHVDQRTGRIVVISVIDNLMKGASGQAVQNMNAMLGLPEHEGLV
jgi:N-acetyl-gamma-glutamyl-phosphate reductase